MYLHAKAYPIIPFALTLLGVFADLAACGWGHRQGKRMAWHLRTAAVAAMTFPSLIGLVVFTGSMGLGNDGLGATVQTGVAITLAFGLLVLVGYAIVAVRWMIGGEWRVAIPLLMLLICLFTFLSEFSLFGLGLVDWMTGFFLIGTFLWVTVDASRRGHSRFWWPLFSLTTLPWMGAARYCRDSDSVEMGPTGPKLNMDQR